MIEQSTEQWRKARLGWFTASRVADATARTKSGYGASRANLMAALIVERLTDIPMESFTTAAMQWGIDHEPDAIAAYEWRHDSAVVPVGFVRHPSIEYAGATPDGAVGADGLIECKCPNSATHIETLISKEIDSRYIKQMQFQMACTGRAWCDFVSFDPRMPPELQLWVQRVERDQKMIDEIEKEARLFLAELESKVSQLRAIGKIEERAA